MSSSLRLTLASTTSLVLAAALSSKSAFMLGPIQPNLVLVVLVVTAFFTANLAFFSILVALSALFVRQTPSLFDLISVATAISALTVFFIKQHAVWPDRLGVLLLIFGATVIMYLVAAPRFLTAHLGMFFLEVIVNIIVGIILFEFFALIVGRRHE